MFRFYSRIACIVLICLVAVTNLACAASDLKTQPITLHCRTCEPLTNILSVRRCPIDPPRTAIIVIDMWEQALVQDVHQQGGQYGAADE